MSVYGGLNQIENLHIWKVLWESGGCVECLVDVSEPAF